MNHDPRPHIHRRRHAIDRLRSLTMGAAVAGLAGTAGFGVLAAASWSGTTTAADDGAATTTDGTSGASGTTGNDNSGSNRVNAAPNTGGTAQVPTKATPRVKPTARPGHASTGGSH